MWPPAHDGHRAHHRGFDQDVEVGLGPQQAPRHGARISFRHRRGRTTSTRARSLVASITVTAEPRPGGCELVPPPCSSTAFELLNGTPLPVAMAGAAARVRRRQEGEAHGRVPMFRARTPAAPRPRNLSFGHASHDVFEGSSTTPNRRRWAGRSTRPAGRDWICGCTVTRVRAAARATASCAPPAPPAAEGSSRGGDTVALTCRGHPPAASAGAIHSASHRLRPSQAASCSAGALTA